MQFPVPQNVEIEDKLIGPLTLKQFLYLLAGGILEFFFFSVFDTELFVLISIPTIGLAAAFAFVKVYDQKFSDFLLIMMRFAVTAKKRVWKRMPGALTSQSTFGQVVKTKSKEEQNRIREVIKEKQLRLEKLDDLVKILDTVGGLEQQVKGQK